MLDDSQSQTPPMGGPPIPAGKMQQSLILYSFKEGAFLKVAGSRQGIGNSFLYGAGYISVVMKVLLLIGSSE